MGLFKKSIAGTSVLALALSLAATSVVTLSGTAAYAERGGNGNGRSNRDRDRSDRDRNENARGGPSERGALARELGSLNAAHANQNALENASSNSMPGKLYVYQQAQQEYAALAAVEDEAYDEYTRLIGLTEEEIAAEFPDGGYEDAVTNAAIALEEAEGVAQEAEDGLVASLDVLTTGVELSEAAMAELNRLLGLE